MPTVTLENTPAVAHLTELAAKACATTSYINCIPSFLAVASTAPGETVAICEYGGGMGDVVVVDSADAAEGDCSNDGQITPSRVVAVVLLP